MKLTKDKKLWIPDNDNWFWRDGYEQKHFFDAMRFISNRGVALDIGAHVGIWTKRLSTIFEKVISFEPVEEHVECWKENCKGIGNVEIHSLAISNKIDTVNMKVTQHNSGMSTLEYNPKRVRTSKVASINTTTIDNFDFDEVDFIKIDTEGHELCVLEGAINTIRKYNPTIFIEIHSRELKKDINAYKFLTDLGYSQILELSGSNFLMKINT